jgi:hypothetical protein
MMRKRRLEEVYNDYAANVLPKEAGAIQRKETRQAFFVGAFSFMGILREATEEGADEAAIVLDLESEMNAFAEATAKAGGRA